MNIAKFNRITTLVGLVSLWLIFIIPDCLILLRYPKPLDIFFIPAPWSNLLAGIWEVMYCPMYFMVFYLFFKNYPAKFNFVIQILMLLLLLNLIMYIRIYNHQNHILKLYEAPASLNDAYWCLLLLPWCLLNSNKIIKYVGIGAITLVVLFSMKRTALLILALSILSYVSLSRVYGNKKTNFGFIFVILLITGIGYETYSTVNTKTGGYFTSRIENIFQDKGSGRVDIYQEVILLISNNTVENLAFGHGHNSVRRFTTDHISAHNDWLEVLFDYGIFIFCIYFWMHGCIIYKSFRLIQCHSFYGPPMVVSYIIFFCMSMGSHLVLYSSYFSYLMAFWGTMEALSSSRSQVARPGFLSQALSEDSSLRRTP
jgi:hypothetical protein